MATDIGQLDRDQWQRFFAHISRTARHRTVSICQMSRPAGSQVVARGPLEGISLEEAGDQHEIGISVGEGVADRPHLHHVIGDPVCLRVLRDEEGHPQCLDVRAGDGSSTLILLSS